MGNTVSDKQGPFMYSCKDIHQKLMSEEQLGLISRFKLRFHIFICSSCKVTISQLENLQKSIHTALSKKSSVSEETARSFEEELKEKFKK
jgi:hypothetical protein